MCLCRGIYREIKKFYEKPKLNNIDREKTFKPFDKFPTVIVGHMNKAGGTKAL